MRASLRRFAWAAACLLGWGQVHAGCVIGVPHPTIHVGSASDPKCNFTSIQAAISSVSTSATCPPNIVIANKPNNAAWNEALTITDRSLALIGNADTCTVNIGGAVPDAPSATAATTPQAIISGAGLNAPVITISGNSNVTVQSLEITGGSIGQDAEGGGIFFNGNGSLTLNTTTVDNNQAGYGAGIDVSPSGSATLTLQANTLILNNTAGHSGGGIRIEGQTRLFMLADGSSVSFNDAQFDYGGGIEILGPARADIGSPGAVFVGAVSNNSAPYGGGIAILGASAGDATARLFSTSTTQPVLVSNNGASADGGAIYVNAFGSVATLCAYNYRIDGNTAPDGAAIYVDGDDPSSLDGEVFLNPQDNCGPESPASLGAVACAVGVPCNEVSDNAAVNGSDMASGSIISMNHYIALAAAGLAMRGNRGTQMISANGSFGGVYNSLIGCLIADNHSAHELVYSLVGEYGGPLTIANCTLANNTIDDGSAIFAIGGVTLTDTIIDEPGDLALDFQVGNCNSPPCVVSASYVMSNDISTLPSSSNIIAIVPGDALFVDAANGNYHLPAYMQNGVLTASRAIDFAPTIGGDAAHDLDGNAYGVDVPAVPDAYGTRDLGAYEAQPITDRIFADGFGDRVSLVR